jgi:hypothetical protein
MLTHQNIRQVSGFLKTSQQYEIIQINHINNNFNLVPPAQIHQHSI